MHAPDQQDRHATAKPTNEKPIMPAWCRPQPLTSSRLPRPRARWRGSRRTCPSIPLQLNRPSPPQKRDNLPPRSGKRHVMIGDDDGETPSACTGEIGRRAFLMRPANHLSCSCCITKKEPRGRGRWRSPEINATISQSNSHAREWRPEWVDKPPQGSRNAANADKEATQRTWMLHSP